MITWIDVETTGVDANADKLLQIALIVTDENLEIIKGSEYEKKVFYTAEEIESLKESTDPYVIEMHNKTNLWNLCTREGIPLEDLNEDVTSHLKKFVPEANTSRLAGNSITLDRNFINEHLPALGEHLHYRSFDVTSISGFAGLFLPSSMEYRKNDSTHEAMDDIRASIEQMKYYRDLFASMMKS